MSEAYGFRRITLLSENAQLYAIEDDPAQPAGPAHFRLVSSVITARPLIQQAIFLLAVSHTSGGFKDFRTLPLPAQQRSWGELPQDSNQEWLWLGSNPQSPGAPSMAKWLLGQGTAVSGWIHAALHNSRPKSAQAILDLHWMAMYGAKRYENRGDALLSLCKEVDKALVLAPRMGATITNADELSRFFRDISKVTYLFKVSSIVS